MLLPAIPPGSPVLSRYGYLTPKAAAEFTGISVQELERLRREGGGAKFCRVSSRLVRYAVEDLCSWLDSHKVSNTAEAAALDAGREVAGV